MNIIQFNTIMQEMNIQLKYDLSSKLKEITKKQWQQFARALKENTSLQQLHLRYNGINNIDTQLLSNSLQYNNTLQQLDINSNQISDIGAEHLSNALQHNTTLQQLNISSNQISDTGAQYLSQALEHNSTLRHLNLSLNQISDIGAQHLSQALQHNHTLQQLDIDSNQLSNIGAQYLSQALLHNHTLQSLNLNYNQINDSGVKHLSLVLQNNSTLTQLQLRCNAINNIGLHHLSHALIINNTLKQLVLHNNQINFIGIKHLSEALRHNASLQQLDLGWNNIGVTGAQYLSQALIHNTTLRILDLSYNHIGNSGAHHFSQALAHNVTLQQLHLESNQIGNAGAQHLNLALKNNPSLQLILLKGNDIVEPQEIKISLILAKNNLITQRQPLSATQSTASTSSSKNSPKTTIPERFFCPITHLIMQQPVMACDGHTYEKEAIEDWFTSGHRKSPCTGESISNTSTLPQESLQHAIQRFLKQDGTPIDNDECYCPREWLAQCLSAAKQKQTSVLESFLLKAPWLFYTSPAAAYQKGISYCAALTCSHQAQYTPYHLLCSNPNTNLRFLQLVILTIDAHIPQLVKHAPIDWCPLTLNRELMNAAINGDTEQCRDWLRLGAQVNAQVQGQSALFWAMQNHAPQTAQPIVHIMLEAHADIHARNHLGQTPLHVCQDTAIAQILLDAGANINSKIQDECALTPLESALKHHHATMIDFLVAYGANLPLKAPFAQQLKDYQQYRTAPSQTQTISTLTQSAHSPPHPAHSPIMASSQVLMMHRNELQFGERIGESFFATVYRGYYQNEAIAIKALKKIPVTPSTLETYQQEAAVMRRQASRYIVPLFGLLLDQTSCCFVTPFMAKGSLYQQLHSTQTLSWAWRHQMATDIAKGLAVLHDKNILHRDLRSHNVLIDADDQAKLADYGLAPLQAEIAAISSIHRQSNTACWMAPELFKIPPLYSEASDCYAYAMVCWELLMRQLPYNNRVGDQSIMIAVQQGKREHIPEYCPTYWKTVIRDNWQPDPEKRYSALKIIHFLAQHENLNEKNDRHTLEKNVGLCRKS